MQDTIASVHPKLKLISFWKFIIAYWKNVYFWRFETLPSSHFEGEFPMRTLYVIKFPH